MKEFVVKDKKNFLDISDNISTPFKFLEVNESRQNEDVLYELKATVWLRTAFITFENGYNKQDYEDAKQNFQDHGFVFATIREAPIALR